MSAKPKLVFLIDSLGAILTTFFLFVVLRNFDHYFGMPRPVLTCLSVIAAGFCIYSTVCFFFLKKNWGPFLLVISVANLLYCLLTIGLVIDYWPVLTVLGVIYFLVEVAIVFVLVYIEVKVAGVIMRSKEHG